jgi:hypothetical protein
MTRLSRFLPCACVVLLALLFLPRAQAGVIVNIVESGGDVVATASGSLDLSGASYQYFSATIIMVRPDISLLFFGPPELPSRVADVYELTSGPTMFGPGLIAFPDSAAGDIFGLNGSIFKLGVPQGYVSGGALSATATWTGATFASLGMTPGVYTWTLPADSFVINVDSGPEVPEPGSLAMFGAAAFGLVVYRFRKR